MPLCAREGLSTLKMFGKRNHLLESVICVKAKIGGGIVKTASSEASRRLRTTWLDYTCVIVKLELTTWSSL